MNQPTIVVISRIFLRVGAAAAVVILGMVLLRTAMFRSERQAAEKAAHVTIASDAAERLAGAVRIKTISHADPAAFDADAFRKLHAYLQRSFPRVHSQLRREVVGTHSLLYTWTGSDPSLKPILLAAHLDVVPVEPGTAPKWAQDPFSGTIANGYVWGRGSIDNKSAVVGALEAVEMLLDEGFRPTRTVYLAYGHDEEVGGTRGAQAIARLLQRRGVTLEMVLDEGGVIGDGVLAGIASPVALVGIAEKGFVTVELSARTPGGHSSLPPPQSAIGIVSAAIARVEKTQMPARLETPTQRLFESIGPEYPLAQRAVFANLWLTRPLVLRRLTSTPVTNAMVRTTTASTVFHAGTKDNVLPTHARAAINFRILPGDTIKGVVDHLERTIDDSRVKVAVSGAFSAEPSTVSSSDSEAFRAIERTIAGVAPDVLVAPYLVVVATDSRHYAGISRNVFRFLPLRLTSGDLDRMHGANERIAVAQYEDAVRFYRQLIINTGEAGIEH